MPIEIGGITYFTLAEVANQVGVSRQTLWRWRRGTSIPQGYRYRTRQVLFSAAELQAITEYANRIEPADARASRQFRLFNGPNRGGN